MVCAQFMFRESCLEPLCLGFRRQCPEQANLTLHVTLLTQAPMRTTGHGRAVT